MCTASAWYASMYLTARCDAAGELAASSLPADAGALGAQVRCLARRPLLEPLVALVLPVACAADAARAAASRAPASQRLPNGIGGHGAADMDTDVAGAGSMARAAPAAHAWEAATSAPCGSASSEFAPGAGCAAEGHRGGAQGAAAETEAGPGAGPAVAEDARALCALLAAVLDAEALHAEALQSDALHTLGAQLVGRLWFSYLRVRCCGETARPWQPSVHASISCFSTGLSASPGSQCSLLKAATRMFCTCMVRDAQPGS